MASFIAYDLIFLVVSTLAVVLFLYTRRKNLQRQGLLYLYRTKLGIKFIEWTSKKFPKTLYFLQYVVVASGFTLMISMIYFLIKFSYFYITSPIAAKAIKVPVIIPLIPYLPRLFKLDFLPPLYFTYWIIIIAIIAIPHEFAHGIFARLNKIRIHSTGFGFLGPFLAAFVEPDEKQMEKAKKFPQLAILAAGTFANIIFTVIFSLIFWLFFISVFTPAGVIFNTYATSVVPINSITSINGVPISDVSEISTLINEDERFNPISVNDITHHIDTYQLLLALEHDIPNVPAILDSPAFRAGVSGAITHIDDKPVTSLEKLKSTLSSYSPGDQIKLTTIKEGQEPINYDIELENLENKAFLGIGVIPRQQGSGLMESVYSMVAKIKDPFIYYESSIGNLGTFIYHLLWWTVLICISVALVNMMPLGIFDGGRFFYLTIWGLTGSKKAGAVAFKISTYAILLLIVALMLKWVFAIF